MVSVLNTVERDETQSKNRRKPMKILIIDDSKMQQKIARIYLEKGEGHNVLTADNGKKGIEAAGEHMPDVILLEIEMPELDGKETIRILKNDPLTMNIPVIMCTSIDDEATKQEMKDVGAAAYLVKPHGFSSIKKILEQVMQGEKNN